MNIQRLRNLTTGILHTDIGCVYQDIDSIVGVEGVMTHMLPAAMRALKPYLREKVTDERFWDGQFDQGHCGDIDVPTMTADEQSQFWGRFSSEPSPLEGKDVVVVVSP